MNPKSAEPAHEPKALFSCSNDSCRQEQSYPADMLYWYDREQRWVCDECWHYLPYESAKGISLAQHLDAKEKTKIKELMALEDACRNFNGRCHFFHSGQGRPCGKCIDCRLRELDNARLSQLSQQKADE